MSLLITERDGPVLTVSLNNPPFNFLTTAMLIELEHILDDTERDPQVRAVVLTSAVPDVFISHYDVGEILGHADRVKITAPPALAALGLRWAAALRRVPGLHRALERTPAAGLTAILRYHDIIARMRASDMVFIAAVTGRALGGGCELTLGCDIRVMADGPYEIGQPEILIGLLPGGGGIQMLTRTLGIGATIELALEGRLLTPRQAFEIGIVQHLAPLEQTRERAHTIARRLARRSPAAVRLVKRAVYDGGTRTLKQGLAIERAAFLSLASRTDTKKAMRTYSATIAEYENSDAAISDFIDQSLPQWLNGTATDFTP